MPDRTPVKPHRDETDRPGPVDGEPVAGSPAPGGAGSDGDGTVANIAATPRATGPRRSAHPRDEGAGPSDPGVLVARG